MVTLSNIKEFLENDSFVTTTEARAKNPTKEAMVVVNRKKDKSTTIVYHVVDSIAKLKPEDW